MFWFFEQMRKALKEKRLCKSSSQCHLESNQVAASLVPGLLVYKNVTGVVQMVVFDRAAAKQQKKIKKMS